MYLWYLIGTSDYIGEGPLAGRRPKAIEYKQHRVLYSARGMSLRRHTGPAYSQSVTIHIKHSRDTAHRGHHDYLHSLDLVCPILLGCRRLYGACPSFSATCGGSTPRALTCSSREPFAFALASWFLHAGGPLVLMGPQGATECSPFSVLESLCGSRFT